MPKSEPTAATRCIFHVDMDAFFASVEQRDRPELRGRAVAVGGDGRRGVVAASSYEARRFGVRSAMPSSRAKRLCPDVVFVRPRHDHYRSVSSDIFAIFHEFSERVEGLSLDEAFLDMTEPAAELDSPVALARAVKRRISAETGLTASIGIGTSKLVAKLASAYDKPDGLTWIAPGSEQAFLDPLPVRRLQGVGPATGARLHDAGILTVGQLRRISPELLEPVLGRQAAGFQRLASGIDAREVSTSRVRRSISQESTFDRDLTNMERIEEVIRDQAGRCAERLQTRGLYARGVHLKLRTAGFSTLSRSHTLAGYTRDADLIADAAIAMARGWGQYQTRISIRLVGVGVSHLAEHPAAEELLQSGPDAGAAPERES